MLARRGFVVGSINYRLTGKAWGTDMYCCPGNLSDQYAVDATHDARAAVRYLRKMAPGAGSQLSPSFSRAHCSGAVFNRSVCVIRSVAVFVQRGGWTPEESASVAARPALSPWHFTAMRPAGSRRGSLARLGVGVKVI